MLGLSDFQTREIVLWRQVANLLYLPIVASLACNWQKHLPVAQQPTKSIPYCRTHPGRLG
jgi:hypothetical protein